MRPLRHLKTKAQSSGLSSHENMAFWFRIRRVWEPGWQSGKVAKVGTVSVPVFISETERAQSHPFRLPGKIRGTTTKVQ